MAKDKTPNAPSLPRAASGQILRAQKAIVTGANSGIGRGVAIALGTAGADVLVNFYFGEEAAQAVAQEIQRCGARAVAHQADVSKEEEVIAMFERAKREFGTTDILVNNAGIQQDAAFVDMTLEQWNRVISVNLTGQFLCAREAVKEFLRRGVVAEVSASAGKIIFLCQATRLPTTKQGPVAARDHRRGQSWCAQQGRQEPRPTIGARGPGPQVIARTSYIGGLATLVVTSPQTASAGEGRRYDDVGKQQRTWEGLALK